MNNHDVEVKLTLTKINNEYLKMQQEKAGENQRFIAYGGRRAGRNIVQKFLDEHGRELEERIKKDMVSVLAYGDRPETAHIPMRMKAVLRNPEFMEEMVSINSSSPLYVGFDNAVPGGDRSSLYQGCFYSDGNAKNAYNAMMEYEINMINKYDRGRLPSQCPPKGERMIDFADKYGVTIKDMKKQAYAVEREIEKGKDGVYRR